MAVDYNLTADFHIISWKGASVSVLFRSWCRLHGGGHPNSNPQALFPCGPFSFTVGSWVESNTWNTNDWEAVAHYLGDWARRAS